MSYFLIGQSRCKPTSANEQKLSSEQRNHKRKNLTKLSTFYTKVKNRTNQLSSPWIVHFKEKITLVHQFLFSFEYLLQNIPKHILVRIKIVDLKLIFNQCQSQQVKTEQTFFRFCRTFDKMVMKSIILIVISALCVSESLRPRGVPPDMANFYDPNSNFHCLDGSGEIPFEHVNDDYCDCKVYKSIFII